MEIIFSAKALKYLKHWQASGKTKIQNKITALVSSIAKKPFNGIGKPKPLKHEFAGCWSRRIIDEHRVIYEVHTNSFQILSLKDHYF